MNERAAVKSGIWFTASNFLVKGIGFITTPIFTRMLTKAEFGDFNNFTTWVNILMIVTSLNLESSLIRARFDFEDHLDEYIFSMQLLSMISTGAWFLVSLLFRKEFSSVLSIENNYINAMFLYLLFFPLINLFQNMERFKYKYRWTVASSLIVSVGSSLLSVVLVMFMKDKLAGRVLGYILPVILLGLVIFFYYFVKIHKVNFNYWKYALPFALPFIPHLLSMLLLGGMDKVMIKHICGAEDLAMYSLAYSVGSLITILVTSINNAYSPWLGEQLANENYQRVYRFSEKYVLLFVYAAVAAVLITPEILLILGGRTYMNAVHVMPPVAAGCIMQFIYCMYVNVEQFEKKTMGMAIASMIAAVINGVLNAIFIPLFGYVAAAYTTFIGYLCLMLMHIFLVHKIHMSKVYQNKKILLTAVLSSALIFVSDLILQTNVVRYVILAAYLMIGVMFVYRNKEAVMKLVRRLR